MGTKMINTYTWNIHINNNQENALAKSQQTNRK